MTKNLKNAYGTECHYAGLTKRPCRINSSYNLGLTLYGMMKESEEKYGKGINDEKYLSFIFKGKGLGIYRHNGYIYLGVRLFGVQTLLMVVEGIGAGKDACLAYDFLTNSNQSFLMEEYNYEDGKAGKFKVDFDLEEYLQNSFNNWIETHLVGDVVEMKEVEKGDLDEYEKKEISKLFEKIMDKASSGYARMQNPDLVAEDEPNLKKVREILAA